MQIQMALYDGIRYREQSELRSWETKQPLGRFFHFLSQNGWWTSEENKKLKDGIRHEVQTRIASPGQHYRARSR